MNAHNFTVAIFLLLCYSSLVLSISPIYFFNSTYHSEINVPLTFNELNLNTNTIQTLDSITFDGKEYDYEEFLGVVIYYKTGVLYANYWQIIGPETYQSNLLAVDTSTGKLLFKDFKYCEGTVSGLAIDQTNGDIHFLNSTDPYEIFGLTVDWTKWNIENNVTTIIQHNANTNIGPYGAIVFNSFTNSLIQLDILGENLIIYQANLPLLNITTGGSWFMMTINSKTGDLIVTTSGTSPSVVYILLVAVNGSSLNKKILCHFPADNYTYTSSNDASDFDYTSNTWVAGIEEASSKKFGGPYNAFFHVNIDTCAKGFYYYSSENNILQGIPRFNSGSSF